MEPVQATALTSGQTDWLYIGISTAVMILLARFFLSGRDWIDVAFSKVPIRGRFTSLLRYLGLVE